MVYLLQYTRSGNWNRTGARTGRVQNSYGSATLPVEWIHMKSTLRIEKNPECTPSQFFTDVVLRRRSGLPPNWRRRSLTGSGLSREMRRTTSVRGSGSSALPLSSPRHRRTLSTVHRGPVFRIRNYSQSHFAAHLNCWNVAKVPPPSLFFRQVWQTPACIFFSGEGGHPLASPTPLAYDPSGGQSGAAVLCIFLSRLFGSLCSHLSPLSPSPSGQGGSVAASLDI